MSRSRRGGWPWTTTVLVALMVYAFGMERHAMSWGIINQMMDDFSFNWTAFLSNPMGNWPRFISHTFMHANTSHIVGNVIFFLLFAPAVERETGHLLFAFLYMVWGVAAASLQGFFEPYSQGLIGASGAISGAAGAYFVLFPLKSPPNFLTRVFGHWLRAVPAFFWIGLWFLAQLKGGFRAVMPDMAPGETIQVAYWAHVGGFGAGALSMAPLLWRRQKPETT